MQYSIAIQQSTINIIVDIFFNNNFVLWFFFFCNCFFFMFDTVARISLQKLYEMHSEIFFQCRWFLQCNKAIQQQIQQQFRQYVIQQSQHLLTITTEKIRVFECRRCHVKFNNNTKLYNYVKDRYAKKSKIFLFILLFIFLFVLLTVISTRFLSKFFMNILYTFSQKFSSSFLFSQKPFIVFLLKFFIAMFFLHLQRLINYNTKLIFNTLSSLSSKLYFTMLNLYNMFYGRNFLSLSSFIKHTHLFQTFVFDIRQSFR